MNQQINYEEAKSLAANIQKSSTLMKDLLDRSDSSVKRIQSNWEGTSADYAMEDWSSWKKDFEEYYQILLTNVKNIENACNSYLETESKMQGAFNQN